MSEQERPDFEKGLKETDYWRTPRLILDAVDEFFLDDDWYDPCPVDPFHNALESSYWGSDVYINPPFSNYLAWVTCARQHYAAAEGFVCPPDYLFMCNLDCSTKWFEQLITPPTTKTEVHVCLLRNRVKFEHDTLKSSSNRNSQAIVYWGTSSKHFKSIFGKLGPCFKLY